MKGLGGLLFAPVVRLLDSGCQVAKLLSCQVAKLLLCTVWAVGCQVARLLLIFGSNLELSNRELSNLTTCELARVPTTGGFSPSTSWVGSPLI